ncbi:hypothetical protein ACQP3J_33055, partial [Escherichia coli]
VRNHDPLFIVRELETHNERETDLFSVLQTLGISLVERQNVSQFGLKSSFSIPNHLSLSSELLIG